MAIVLCSPDTVLNPRPTSDRLRPPSPTSLVPPSAETVARSRRLEVWNRSARALSPLTLPPSPSLSSCETISSQRASKRSRSQSVVGKMLSKTTELAKKVCPRLRDLVTAPAGGITQSRTNFFGQLCTHCCHTATF